jgi:hypothetical protein
MRQVAYDKSGPPAVKLKWPARLFTHRKGLAVRATDDLSGNEEFPLFEREQLAAYLESILHGEPDAADVLARLFNTMRHALDDGLSGINQTKETLLIAVELAYLRSGAHDSALRLYRRWLEGHLLPGDEPDTLHNVAIARSERSVRAARTAGRARRRT